jgi:AraC-like DNA-binding protein
MTTSNLDIARSKAAKTEEVVIDLSIKNTPRHSSFYDQCLENKAPKIEINKTCDKKVNNKSNNNIVEIDLHIEELLEKKQSIRLEKNVSYSSTVKDLNKNWFVEICMRVFRVNQFKWLKMQRLLKARALLINSEFTLEEIGRKVGYKNVTEFSVAYKEEFNLSPYQQKNLT